MTWVTTRPRLATTRRPIPVPALTYAQGAHDAPEHLTRSFTLQKEGTGFGIMLTVITVVLTIGAIWYGLTR